MRAIGFFTRQQFVQSVLRCFDGGHLDPELAQSWCSDGYEEGGDAFASGAEVD
jgi:hypothetical protein